ncbi:P-loop containing nucleoside triphosphate hydrolase [Gracilaria domingensis]|nr:P-loop containing nucleoside triphosphate hydrolase [Gracilaria domingensis]
MTTIDRLGIRGIRSYGADKETFIKFYKPLTIILGRNGSGKSTVIEAVKMATTGDLPPMVERGAAFIIHDPRINNETETKAKIRLMFSNARGDQYIVARHFQLTLKRATRGTGYKTEFKTLDQTLKRMSKDDPGSTSSYRCNDINALLPQVMGVTKPVLNNVIFVHQEDSLWPLSDPKTLKEKFDDIFAATRYTKALDIIRKYRKDQAAELKTIKVELMHYEEKVQALEQVRSEVDEIRVRHDEYSKGIQQLNEEIGELNTELSKAEQVTAAYRSKQSELEKLRGERSRIEKDKAAKFAEMKLHLPELDEQALRNEISELDSFLGRADGERAKRSGIIEHLEEDLKMLRQELSRRTNRKGKLEQLENMHTKHISRLKELKEELLSTEHEGNQVGSDAQRIPLQSKNASFQDWKNALQQLTAGADEAVHKAALEGNKEVDKASTKLNEEKLVAQSLKAEMERKQNDIRANRSKISDIRRELGSLEESRSSIAELENKVKTAERILGEKNESNRVSELEKSISGSRKQASSLRQDLGDIRILREQLAKDQSEQARFDISVETAARKRTAFERLTEDFVDILLSSVDDLLPFVSDRGDLTEAKESLASVASNPSEAGAKENKEAVMEACNRILASNDVINADATRLKTEASQALNSITSRREELRTQLDEAKKSFDTQRLQVHRSTKKLKLVPQSPAGVHEVAALIEQVTIASNEDTLRPQVLEQKHVEAVNEAVEKMDTELLQANQRISQLESGPFLAEQELEIFDKDPKHRCPACGISSSKKQADQRKSLLARVQNYKNPELMGNAKDVLKKIQDASQVLRQLQSQSANALVKGQSYKAASAKIVDIDKEIRKFALDAEKASSLVAELEKGTGRTSSMKQIPSKRIEFEQNFVEFQKAAREVESQRMNLTMGGSESRSLNEVEKEMRTMEEEMNKLQDSIDRDGRTLDREKDEIRRAENRVHLARQNLLQQNTNAESHKRLTLAKKEIVSLITELDKSLLNDASKAKQLENDIEYYEQELAVVRVEAANNLKRANELLSKRRMQIQQWNNCFHEVEAYERSGRQSELSDLLTSLDNIMKEIETKDNDKRAQEKELQTASDAQREMEAKIRNLRDNQRYRIQEQELAVNARSIRHVQDELSAIERETGMIPMEKVDQLRNTVNEKNSARHATLGKRQVFVERYKEKKGELAVAEKAGSRRKFEECRIQRQTMELASGDLERYHRALDQALVAFHTLKMRTINRTIKELWQQTYRGTDIDEIEITSDSSNSRAIGGTVTRNFQYRVQMRQGQATLDMRGRCSAGQKVLACLVIRLALAESFCSDCGILALDEPTTNLDRENIESLASALKAIIENRRQQRNFQLLLITHDQEFIEMIGARDFCNDYFRIVKDADGISRAQIEELRQMF